MSKAASLETRNRRMAYIAVCVALVMLGGGFAAVPLYRIFCQVTGFQGTTQRVDVAQARTVAVTGQTMSVRFDANVHRDLQWTFAPSQSTVTVALGERKTATYKARNNSNRPITGVASFNVSPELAGKYFNKIQCFCFNEQTLQPGQEVSMPVLFFVDPKIMDDPEANKVKQITLSYTFFEAAGTKPHKQAANLLDHSDHDG